MHQIGCFLIYFKGATVEISFAKPIDKNNHNQLAKVSLKFNWPLAANRII